MQKILIVLLSLFIPCCYANEAALDKLTVALDWFPNPDHAPLAIAKQLGFFKEQGLDVTLLGPVDPTDPPKWVATGKVDIGITYEPQYMIQIDQGLPLITIGTLIDKPLNCIVTLQESGITKLSELKNKKIGSTINGLENAMLTTLLNKQDLQKKDIELINIRYNLTQALLSHKVDAVTGMNRNFEVPLLESAGHKMNVFFPEEYGIPNYSELIFVIHKANLTDKRIPRFLAALKRAVAYLDLHPHEAWESFIKLYPEANNQKTHDIWFATIPYFAEDPTTFSRNDWEKFSQFMFEHKIIKKIQPISRYAVKLPKVAPTAPT